MNRLVLLVLLGLASSLSPACAQKSADTLRVVWRDQLPDIDPYHSGLRGALILSLHVWDTLVYRDPDTLQIRPLLATIWHVTDPGTIEFTLRDDVHFQNGDAFTADDVAYTINQLRDDTRLATPTLFGMFTGAEAIDPTHVRVHVTQDPTLALEYIATLLPMLPHDYRGRVGAAGFSAAPIGTGPYRVVSQADNAIVLDRNDTYMPGSAKGHPAIAHLEFRSVPDTTQEIADLLGGRADWIWDFDPSQFITIDRAPNVQALRAETMRFGYLAMSIGSAGGAMAANTNSTAANPFADARVREAVAHAIDRQGLARQFGAGVARVLDAPCYPTQFGCDQAVATKWNYDPDRARALLTEAGFPDGFATTMVSTVLPQWANAVQNYLRVAGIDVTVRQVQPAAVAPLLVAGQVPLMLGTWGSYSINDASAVLPHFFGGGDMDLVRDPVLIGLMHDAAATMDADRRRAAYVAAIRRLTAAADFLPLQVMVATYGFSRELNFRAFPDELPRFYLSSWK